jgi:hypothetical protein
MADINEVIRDAICGCGSGGAKIPLAEFVLEMFKAGIDLTGAELPPDGIPVKAIAKIFATLLNKEQPQYMGQPFPEILVETIFRGICALQEL